MKCYACDCLLSVETNPDPKTGRYYCGICMEPTNNLLMAMDLASLETTFSDPFKLVDEEASLDDTLSFEQLKEQELNEEDSTNEDE